MRISCPLVSPVSVIDYVRYRFGRWERVCLTAAVCLTAKRLNRRTSMKQLGPASAGLLFPRSSEESWIRDEPAWSPNRIGDYDQAELVNVGLRPSLLARLYRYLPTDSGLRKPVDKQLRFFWRFCKRCLAGARVHIPCITPVASVRFRYAQPGGWLDRSLRPTYPTAM